MASTLVGYSEDQTVVQRSNDSSPIIYLTLTCDNETTPTVTSDSDKTLAVACDSDKNRDVIGLTGRLAYVVGYIRFRPVTFSC